MEDPLFVIVVVALGAVAIILMIGIGGFGRGGEFNRKYANKIMRLRIAAQFVAVDDCTRLVTKSTLLPNARVAFFSTSAYRAASWRPPVQPV